MLVCLLSIHINLCWGEEQSNQISSPLSLACLVPRNQLIMRISFQEFLIKTYPGGITLATSRTGQIILEDSDTK